ncbi:unnamed protein product [Euphydryas editha]|uniref:Uncharacterized protein n=1 Tax=Euphydryas editha TaxID=104508 RepID=A0AAU9U498_EUPED|nr:unnamed protein product [Euphydryas editha]
MAKMETSLNLQVDLSSRIFKARVNFKKSPKERVTKDFVMCRLESLEQLWSEFRKGHRALLQQSDPQLLEKVSYIASDTYNDTEEEYMIYKCELKRHLPDVDIRDNPGKCSDSNVRVKLPKISIPTFSGKYTEWITFRDLFVSMIHNNTSLDNVQKLQYLKGFLTGEAEQLIRYIPVSDANYEQCWKMLEKRYSNKKYLSNCILKRLLSQRNATSESASFLKELIDTSSDCLNALTNLGINVSTWDIIVIHLLSIKLDSESRKQWELNVTMNVPSDSLPTFSQFKDFLTSRYRALEFIEPKHVNKQINSNIKSNISNPKVLHTTGVTRLLCELCGEEHKLSFCKKFGNLDCESRQLLKFMNQNREQEDNKIEEKKNKELEIKLDNIVKILGLTWNSTRDEFQYSVKLPPLSAPVTKRKIISDVARLYDPLGWIAPCVIKAKIFIQRLWIAGTGWDEEPPEDILNDWYTYRKKHPGFDWLTRVVSLKCKNSIIKRPTSKLIILPVCD